MNAKTYIPQIHTHVIFEPAHALECGSFDGPCAIIHHTGSRVWVGASCYDLPFQKEIDGVLVCDDKGPAFDQEGNGIVSINVRHVRSYLDEAEAEGIEACMDADRRLLDYARG